MEFTHNLKIILLDSNNNIIEDKITLDEIKNVLTTNNTHLIEWNGILHTISIKWDKVILNEINQVFMGDLFSSPIYDFDKIILNHTRETISKIECKYKISFYISRILKNKIVDKNSIGLII
jgi:hypothetical protein